MKKFGILLVLVLPAVSIILLFFTTGVSSRPFNADEFSANLSRIWVQPKTIEPVLKNYPFPLLSPAVTIAEGFEAYDGTLHDTPGDFHWAIDYVQTAGGAFLEFPVFSAHDGVVFQGEGNMWGKFVVVKDRSKISQGYNTLYSHLDSIPTRIPFMQFDINGSNGVLLPAGSYIGQASTTGNAKGIPQLHFEFHTVDLKTGATLRGDPYGVYQRLSSGFYPQPGDSLEGLLHYWETDNPFFAGSLPETK
ncbi:MAG: M23 family metallopeptidase [Candidatus Wildermuthbacteria bacterium]|nr:M23 family metallopeptidase [Candidatus Wildermuthbacteria bacterium]